VRLFSFIFLGTGVLFFLSACQTLGFGSPSDLQQKASFSPYGKWKVFQKKVIQSGKKLAVLPFYVAGSDSESALDLKRRADLIRACFYGQIARLNYDKVNLQKTDYSLKKHFSGLNILSYYNSQAAKDENRRKILENQKQARLAPKNANDKVRYPMPLLASTHAKKLAKALGVDLLVAGMGDYTRLYAVAYSHVKVFARVEMYSGETGERIWMAEDFSLGASGGLPTGPTAALMTIISAVSNLRDINIYRETDNLFREFAKTIPAPGGENLQRQKPAFTSGFCKIERGFPIQLKSQEQYKVFGTIATNKNGTLFLLDPLKAKEAIKSRPGRRQQYFEILEKCKPYAVALVLGESTCEASFSLGTLLRNVEMSGTDNVYVGFKQIPEGIEQKNVPISFKLTLNDVPNLIHEWDRLDIDSRAPDAPSLSKTVPQTKGIKIEWLKGRAALQGIYDYWVWRSEKPEKGFVKIAETGGSASYEDKSVAEGVYYYKVSAWDKNGNQSQKSPSARGIYVRPGKHILPAIIAKDTVFIKTATYIIDKPVVLKTGYTLSIEEGTEVFFRDKGSLIIEGRLNTNKAKITSQRTANARLPLIQFRKEGKGLMKETLFTGTSKETGVSMASASPSILNCQFNLFKTALAVRGKNARPEIKNTVFTGNTLSLSTQNESQPLLQNCRFLPGRGTAEIYVLNLSATTLDIKNNYWGTTKPSDFLDKLSGRLDFSVIQNEKGATADISSYIAKRKTLPSVIRKTILLSAAGGPYDVSGKIVVTDGATLLIQSGAVLRFKTGTARIEILQGSIHCAGTFEHPVLFTSRAKAKAIGDYKTGIILNAPDKYKSKIQGLKIEYAWIGIEIRTGKSHEITYCHFRKNKIGLQVSGLANSLVTYSLFRDNEKGILVLDKGNPKIKHCAFVLKRQFGLINRSRNPYIDARENWWDGKLKLAENAILDSKGKVAFDNPLKNKPFPFK